MLSVTCRFCRRRLMGTDAPLLAPPPPLPELADNGERVRSRLPPVPSGAVGARPGPREGPRARKPAPPAPAYRPHAVVGPPRRPAGFPRTRTVEGRGHQRGEAKIACVGIRPSTPKA